MALSLTFDHNSGGTVILQTNDLVHFASYASSHLVSELGGHCSQQFNCCELIWHQAGMMTWENVRYEDNIVGYQLYYSELFLEEHVLYNPAVHPPWQKSALLLLFL